ncbi:MAG: hypothetical protein WD942_07940, partial [Dehalococcoidia bacterium]
MPAPQIESLRLAIIGMGYVGLPLAVEFGKGRAVIGFDINKKRIEQLQWLCLESGGNSPTTSSERV